MTVSIIIHLWVLLNFFTIFWEKHITMVPFPFPLLQLNLGRVPATNSHMQTRQTVQVLPDTRQRFDLFTVYVIHDSYSLFLFDHFFFIHYSLLQGGWLIWTNLQMWCISFCSFLKVLIMIFLRKINKAVQGSIIIPINAAIWTTYYLYGKFDNTVKVCLPSSDLLIFPSRTLFRHWPWAPQNPRTSILVG